METIRILRCLPGPHPSRYRLAITGTTWEAHIASASDSSASEVLERNATLNFAAAPQGNIEEVQTARASLQSQTHRIKSCTSVQGKSTSGIHVLLLQAVAIAESSVQAGPRRTITATVSRIPAWTTSSNSEVAVRGHHSLSLGDADNFKGSDVRRGIGRKVRRVSWHGAATPRQHGAACMTIRHGAHCTTRRRWHWAERTTLWHGADCATRRRRWHGAQRT